MNEKLAKTLGIKFIKKQSHGGKRGNCDVAVVKQKGNRYTISFSDAVANKLGSHVRYARGNNRLWIASGVADEYGYKIIKQDHSRGYTGVAISSIGFIDDFIGDHELKYSADMDAYYILSNKSAEKGVQA